MTLPLVSQLKQVSKSLHCIRVEAFQFRHPQDALKRQFPLILRVDGAVAGRFEGPVVVQPERGALSISNDHV
jgi:hypothetical protein